MNEIQKDIKFKKFLANLGTQSIFYTEETERISILMIFTSQELIYEQFKTIIKSIILSTKKYVFSKYSNTLFLSIISNNKNEKISVLESLLDLFFSLVRFRMGLNCEKSEKKFQVKRVKKKKFFGGMFGSLLSSVGSVRSKVILKPLVCSLNDLLEKGERGGYVCGRSSIIFKAIESVEIERHLMRFSIVKIISVICKKIKQICHCIIWIGNRVLCIFSNPNLNWVLKPEDVLNLMVFINSIQYMEGFKEYKKDEKEVYEQVYMFTKYNNLNRVNFFVKRKMDEQVYLKHKTFKSLISISFITFDDPKKEFLPLLRKTEEKIRNELKIYDYSFLNLKANHHFTLEHIIKNCPGLIHFVFIDKMRGRLLSPKIMSVKNKFSKNSKFPELSKDYIKKKTIEMKGMISKFHDLNFSNVIITTKEIIYSFKEWLVTKNKKRMKFSTKNLIKQNIIGSPKKFLQKESVSKLMGHYQLYTMYYPNLDTKEIEKNNEELIKILGISGGLFEEVRKK